jgi:hypothetical protein
MSKSKSNKPIKPPAKPENPSKKGASKLIKEKFARVVTQIKPSLPPKKDENN